MFDLEQSISEWRGQMLAAGIKSPVPLEELESHLQEEIERQIKSGLSEQHVFNLAIREIGHAIRRTVRQTTAAWGWDWPFPRGWWSFIRAVSGP
jgi:hypothetical protein